MLLCLGGPAPVIVVLLAEGDGLGFGYVYALLTRRTLETLILSGMRVKMSR